MKRIFYFFIYTTICFMCFPTENCYPIQAQGKCIYINSNGKVTSNIVKKSQRKTNINELISKFDYTYISEFKNGYAYALKRITSDYYIPYYENGEVIQGAEELISGIYGGIINTKGKEIISFSLGEYTEVSDNCVKCKERYADSNGNHYSMYGFKNLKNQWILKPQYLYADNFKFGYAEVSKDMDDFYLIDKKGNIKLRNNYKYIYVLGKNKFIVSHNKKDFYICDINGKELSSTFQLIKIIDNDMCLAESVFGKFYLNSKGKFFYFKDYLFEE